MRELEGPGYVYAIISPAYPGYVKLGHTKSLGKRLVTMNTASPYRDFSVAHAVFVERRVSAERQLLAECRGLRVEGTEWFRMHWQDARAHMIRLAKQENQ